MRATCPKGQVGLAHMLRLYRATNLDSNPNRMVKIRVRGAAAVPPRCSQLAVKEQAVATRLPQPIWTTDPTVAACTLRLRAASARRYVYMLGVPCIVYRDGKSSSSGQLQGFSQGRCRPAGEPADPERWADHSPAFPEVR